MKLFEVYKSSAGESFFVAAEDFRRVTEVYDCIYSIIKANEKVVVLRNRDGSVGYSDDEWKIADSRFPPKEGENAVQYIQRLCRHIIDVECSNRGYQTIFEKIKPNSEKNDERSVASKD